MHLSKKIVHVNDKIKTDLDCNLYVNSVGVLRAAEQMCAIEVNGESSCAASSLFFVARTD